MLRGATGTPMRRIDFANSALALAEPEPLTLANLTTKSLTALVIALRHAAIPPARSPDRNFCMSQAPVGQRSAHSPQCRQTSSSLTMTRPVLSTVRDIEILVAIERRRAQPRRSSSSSPFAVKVMQSIGQMSTQASHSMHSGVATPSGRRN